MSNENLDENWFSCDKKSKFQVDFQGIWGERLIQKGLSLALENFSYTNGMEYLAYTHKNGPKTCLLCILWTFKWLWTIFKMELVGGKAYTLPLRRMFGKCTLSYKKRISSDWKPEREKIQHEKEEER